MLELYDHILSDRCYTVRLLLGLLGTPYTKRTVAYTPAQSPPSPAVLPLNPAGEIPVLVDGTMILTDLQAVLIHLRKTRDASQQWRAEDPDVLHWLGFACGPLTAISRARAVSLFGAPGDRAQLLAAARAALRIVEDHLTERAITGQMFMAIAPSLADIAAFPAIALSHDCNIGHEDYPAINLWQRRIRRLPGFVSMPGIPDYF